MKTLSIFATVSGQIRQDIILDEKFQMEEKELVKKLNEGKILTTISHGDGNGLVIQVSPFTIIGKVISQEALDDLEISEFEEYGEDE